MSETGKILTFDSTLKYITETDVHREHNVRESSFELFTKINLNKKENQIFLMHLNILSHTSLNHVDNCQENSSLENDSRKLRPLLLASLHFS